MLLLDQSAAFDTVDHELLIADLFQLGLRSRALDYIRSFLTGRSYQVTANGCTSDKRPLLFGVPQGSVLGPLLFVIYTQSLAAELEALGVSYHMYGPTYKKTSTVQKKGCRKENEPKKHP